MLSAEEIVDLENLYSCQLLHLGLFSCFTLLAAIEARFLWLLDLVADSDDDFSGQQFKAQPQG